MSLDELLPDWESRVVEDAFQVAEEIVECFQRLGLDPNEFVNVVTSGEFPLLSEMVLNVFDGQYRHRHGFQTSDKDGQVHFGRAHSNICRCSLCTTSQSQTNEEE